MDILYLLLPLSVVLITAVALALMWAVRSGQFEDLEGPAHRILMDDDRPAATPETRTTERAGAARSDATVDRDHA